MTKIITTFAVVITCVLCPADSEAGNCPRSQGNPVQNNPFEGDFAVEFPEPGFGGEEAFVDTPVNEEPVGLPPFVEEPVAPPPAFDQPAGPTPLEQTPPVVEPPRFEVFMSMPLQIASPGCGDAPGYCVLGFGGFEMPLTVNSWQEGMIEVEMPTMTFAGPTDATLYLYHADETLYAELPLTLLNTAQ